MKLFQALRRFQITILQLIYKASNLLRGGTTISNGEQLDLMKML